MEFNGPDNSYKDTGKKTLMEEIENKKLWIIAVVAAIVIATVFALAYFVNKNIKGLGTKTTVAPVNPSTEGNVPKPLTPEEIQAALNKKVEDPGNTAGGNAPAPKPLTPSEIQDALNKKSTTESSSDVKPLTPQEIQNALNKKQ